MEFIDEMFEAILMTGFGQDGDPTVASTVTGQEMVSMYVRRHLEEFWRKKLQAAQKNYEAATAEYRALLATQPHGAAGVTNNSLARARNAESEALAQYTRVLRIFSELTLHGRTPKEETDASNKP